MIEKVCNNCGKVTLLRRTVKTFVCRCNHEANILAEFGSVALRSLWLAIHYYPFKHQFDWDAAAARAYYDKWCKEIPQYGCSCTKNWADYTAGNPPDFSSAKAFALWGFNAHNYVSKHHAGKPTLPIDDCWLTYWPKPAGYCDDHFVAVTSLAPKPCHRQTETLNSWIDFGLTIHAVNTSAEIVRLRELYPQVNHWHAQDDVPDIFERRTQYVWNLAQMAATLDKTILLINSDIQLIGHPKTLIRRLYENALVTGVRRNFIDTIDVSERERWGLDAFVLTPAMAETLPKLSMAIGQPMWDYWIPHHFRSLGYRMEFIADDIFYHRKHPLNWSDADWLIGARTLASEGGIDLQCNALDFRRSLPFPPP
jgi:hypothetical protein